MLPEDQSIPTDDSLTLMMQKQEQNLSKSLRFRASQLDILIFFQSQKVIYLIIPIPLLLSVSRCG